MGKPGRFWATGLWMAVGYVCGIWSERATMTEIGALLGAVLVVLWLATEGRIKWNDRRAHADDLPRRDNRWL